MPAGYVPLGPDNDGYSDTSSRKHVETVGQGTQGKRTKSEAQLQAFLKLARDRFKGTLSFHEGALVVGGVSGDELHQRVDALAGALSRPTRAHPMR